MVPFLHVNYSTVFAITVALDSTVTEGATAAAARRINKVTSAPMAPFLLDLLLLHLLLK
jgi:hypothetical protein